MDYKSKHVRTRITSPTLKRALVDNTSFTQCDDEENTFQSPSIPIDPLTQSLSDSFSVAEVSVDYSTDGSINDIEESSPQNDNIEDSTNPTNTTLKQYSRGKCTHNRHSTKTQILIQERDLARIEAQEAQDTLAAVLEAIHILTRQLKSPVASAAVPGEDSTLVHDDDDTDKRSSVQGGCQDEEHPSSTRCNTRHDDGDTATGDDGTLLPRPLRNRTWSGVSAAGGVASYATKDALRFSEIVKQYSKNSSSLSVLNSEMPNVGASLIALDDACRSIEQTAKWMSEESSMVLQDLQQAQAELNELDYRCHRAEKCARQLYKENQCLKKDLEKSKGEKRVLVREIRSLMGEKADREAFQKGLLESMRAHEDRMMEQTATSKREGAEKKDEGTELLGGEGAPKDDTKIVHKDTTTSSESLDKQPSATHSKFNPFGKLLQSFSSGSAAVEKNDDCDKQELCHLSTPSITTTPIPNTATSQEYSEDYLDSMDVVLSASTSTLLQTSKSTASEYSYDTSSVLQLTPTLSTCDSMKSTLSANDLNYNDHEPQGQTRGSNETSIFGRTKNSQPYNTSRKKKTSWVRQVNAANPQTSTTVISVKLPRNKKINMAGLTPTSVSNAAADSSLQSMTKETQFRQYTIS